MLNMTALMDGQVKASFPSTEDLVASGENFLDNTVGSIQSKVSNSISVDAPSSGITGFSTASDLNASGAGVNKSSMVDTNHKVKLSCSVYDAPSYYGPNNPVGFVASDLSYRLVEFDNMPAISEGLAVQYEPISLPHLPAAFQKYKTTESITYSIEALFTARNSNEAFRNYVFYMNLKAWTKPFFGLNQMRSDGTRGKLGAPPPVLQFSGYRGLIDVPVVITKIDIPHPNDCDWIPMGYNNMPFPTVLKISISLIETYSADQLNNFNLANYRLGEPSSAIPTEPQTETMEKTSGISDPTSAGAGRGNVNPTMDEQWQYQYGGELRPWEYGNPEFK